MRTLSALRGGRLKVNVSCQGVKRGTLTLTVDRATARKLKLKSSTLARKTLDCGDRGARDGVAEALGDRAQGLGPGQVVRAGQVDAAHVWRGQPTRRP